MNALAHIIEADTTRYFAISASTRKNRPLTNGFDTEADARDQAEFLSEYGGVAMVTTNKGDILGKFSIAKGWH